MICLLQTTIGDTGNIITERYNKSNDKYTHTKNLTNYNKNVVYYTDTLLNTHMIIHAVVPRVKRVI